MTHEEGDWGLRASTQRVLDRWITESLASSETSSMLFWKTAWEHAAATGRQGDTLQIAEQLRVRFGTAERMRQWASETREDKGDTDEWQEERPGTRCRTQTMLIEGIPHGAEELFTEAFCH